MKTRIMILTMFMVGALSFTLSPVSFAEVINVGNKVCPVSGEAIGSMGDAFKVQHDGKEYNLCCKMCVKDFKKNPDKYIKIVEAEAETQSDHAGHAMEHKAEKEESSDGHSGHHGHHDHH